MAKRYTLGIYHFRITKEKVRDYFLKNGYNTEHVAIYEIKEGQRFISAETGEPPNMKAIIKLTEGDKQVTVKAGHTIFNFFKHMFHLDGKITSEDAHLVSDRNGFVLRVETENVEQTLFAMQILTDRGAAYVKDLYD